MDGHTFSTSEHCYQWSAATQAIRKDVAEAIIKAKSPWYAKRLGASIKNQIQNWNDMKYDVMHNVLIAKACTSEHFKDEFLATGNKLLCEALIDEFWGSGPSYNLTITTKPEHWLGANNLGKILMNVRADLRKEDLKENQSSTQLSAPDMLSPTVALPSTTGTEKHVSQAPKRTKMSNSKVRSSSASASMFHDFIRNIPTFTYTIYW